MKELTNYKSWDENAVFFNFRKKGLGLKTEEPIKKEDFVMEHISLAISRKYFNKVLKCTNSKIIFIMKIDCIVYLDLTRHGSIARYINCSYDSNYKVAA